MKPVSLIVVLFFFCAQLFAQDPAQIAATEARLQIEKTDTGKARVLHELFLLTRDSDSLKAMQYVNDALELNRKASFKKGESLVLLNKGVFLGRAGEYEEAKNLIDQSLQIRTAESDLPGQGYCLKALGTLEYDRNNYSRALEMYLAAADKFEKGNDQKGLCGDYIWIGNVFNEGLNQFEKAAEYFNKSLAIADKLNDSLLKSYNYNNLGQAYYLAKKYPEAFTWYFKSKRIKEALHDVRGTGNAFGNISNVFFDLKKYDSAKIYNDSALSIRISQNDKKGIATCYLNGGNILLVEKQYERAFDYYTKAVTAAKEVDFKQALIESYNGISQFYEYKGDTKQALFYFKKYKALTDTVFNSDIASQIGTLQAKYESAKKEQLIEKQRFELVKKQYWIYGGAVLIILGLLLARSRAKRNRLHHQKRLQTEVMKQQELATEAVIEAEENERSRIARDLHDGVGQMMSAAKMNLSLLENLQLNNEGRQAFEKAVLLVDESCREVRTVSHNMMPNALIKSGLASAVRTFIHQIESPALKVQLYTEGLNESINKNTETVLYRVLQECVNNVIRHAKASNLDIALIKDASGINATIEDNGKGFDTSDKSTYAGVGLDNMVKRISFLKGTIEWQSSPQAGTLVAIYVPA